MPTDEDGGANHQTEWPEGGGEDAAKLFGPLAQAPQPAASLRHHPARYRTAFAGDVAPVVGAGVLGRYPFENAFALLAASPA